MGSEVCCQHSSLSSRGHDELNKHSSRDSAWDSGWGSQREYKRTKTVWDYWWVRVLYQNYCNVVWYAFISIFHTFCIYRWIPASSHSKVRRWKLSSNDVMYFIISAPSSSRTTMDPSITSSTPSAVSWASGTFSSESCYIEHVQLVISIFLLLDNLNLQLIKIE